jgi:hypothetical protein
VFEIELDNIIMAPPEPAKPPAKKAK